MKPSNWDRLSSEEKIDFGNRLMHSARGRYLLAQALVVASETMRAEPEPHRETSNIQDMEVLYETIFGVFAGAILMDREMRKKRFTVRKAGT